MLEIGELWVNWTEGAEYGYQVYQPFEWKEEDPLERILRVPAFNVSAQFFDYLENGFNELPEALFLDIQNERNPYCFVASDGFRTLVVDTLGYQTPMRKSRMGLEQERLILRYLRHEEVKNYPMAPSEPSNGLFALLPEHMIGLTRAEREKKQLLIDALYALKKGKKAEILYYYIEFNPTCYKEVKTLKKDALFTRFISETKTGWTENHEHLLHIFLNQNEELQLLYEIRV